ncbi:MAG: two-component regulator propeller domain-containing protein [Bacteroidota bacterium]
MKKIILFFIILLINQVVPAQNVGVGQWKDYLSYNSGISVAEGGGKVYCATKSGIFFYNKGDNSIERLSKITGLADVEATVVNFNYNNNKLLVAYKNSNIDIIDNGTIINLGDIQRKTILGNKSINNVYFINQYAYLACGFGIVVIDMDRLEVSDTYYIGPNGGAVNVRDITSDGTSFYAATDAGIYTALQNSPNLANYSSWSVMGGLPNGIYNTITEFNGKIFTNFSKLIANGISYQDTIYVYDNVSWSYFIPPVGLTIKSIKKCNNNLLVTQSGAISTYGPDLVNTGYIAGYFNDVTRAENAVADVSGNIWIADSKYGLVGWRPGLGIFSYFPDGPASSNVGAMSVAESVLAVAPGGGANGYFTDGLYLYDGSTWRHTVGNYPSIVNLDTIVNIRNVLVDPVNPRKIYATTGLAGLIEFYDGIPVKLYDQSNSSLQALSLPGYTPVWTSGVALDAVNNLWVSNSGVPSCISVKKADDTWQALNFSPFVGSVAEPGQILIDKNNQKWIVLTRGVGLMVYNGTGAAPSAANTKKFSTSTGNGALPSTNVFCLAEDMDGEIWVGTDKGVAVFYSPESVFSGDNFDSQQILIEQDGHVQILFETELIQSIAVDAANRKWIATVNSGVFLMSADGTQQIHHFDVSNSPLFSNDVKSVVINHKTGEVYFATTKGIIAFRGTATGAGEFFTDVYSFPNPVKHSYDGPIAIKGLVNNTILKITDISGSLVYETKSEGGQALWYGKNFNGERVSSGVYMVFCASEDGSQKMVTKILFIN